MRALVYNAPGSVVMDDWPNPTAHAGELEIAVSLAGICGADVAGFLGRSRSRKPPLVLGHEFVGRAMNGRRVVADPVIACGHCPACGRGATNLCENLRLLGMGGTAGCFAEFVVVPESQIHTLPHELEDELAILAEPLANIVHLFRLASPQPGFRLGIVGAGTMGAMTLQLALQLGADEVMVEETEETRCAVAKKMGASVALNPPQAGGDAPNSTGAALDLVVDACGTEEARQRAMDLCRPGGTVVFLGLAADRSAINFADSIRKELRLLTSFGYTRADFKRALDLLAAGAVDLRPWTAHMRLEEGQAAFERFVRRRGDTLKILLRI